MGITILDHLIRRINGPLAFRFIIQPVVAATIAIIAGVKDAREGRPPHGWTMLIDSTRRYKLIQESWKQTAKVFVAAVIIDLIYEVIELGRIYLGQSLIVATLLALIPYLLIRGPANRIARRWSRLRKRSSDGDHKTQSRSSA